MLHVFWGPFRTEEAKHKCINAAKSKNYTHVGVMGGYCVHTEFDDRQDGGQVHDKCKNGVGKYDPSSTTQYMDVYKIISSIVAEPSKVEKVERLQSFSGAPSIGNNVLYSIAVMLLAVIVIVKYN